MLLARLLYQGLHQVTRALCMGLEHVGPVLENALRILHIPLLGCKSRVDHRLKSCLQLLRLLCQLLCQMPAVFGIAFEDLNAVLQRTLGELHIPLLDRSCTLDDGLVRLLNGCCQTLCRLIYGIFRHYFFLLFLAMNCTF